ncbi:MAG: c-type cytochrome [Pseudomonadota bacterium]
MKKLLAALVLCSGATAIAADAPANYQTCFACHSSGAAGAPKTGDAAAWAPRLEKGMPELITSVRTGIGAMPPGGLCPDCTDDELKALIDYMATPAN